MVWFKPGLDREQLKKEYRSLAKKYHPDLSKDPNAEEKMKEINEQFDDYFTRQAEFEYGWASQAAEREKSKKVRATVLVYLLRDKYNEGRFFAIVENKERVVWDYSFSWLFGGGGYHRERTRIKGITTDDKAWDGFRGGFAYCTYGDPNDMDEVSLNRLPATIEPATLEELYFYNKATWADSEYDLFEQRTTRFGTIWSRVMHSYRRDGYENITAYMKATLPPEFLALGKEGDKDAEYEARQIKPVQISTGYIRESKVLKLYNGADIPFVLFQDCTYKEFQEYHDVDIYPQYADIIPATELSMKNYGRGNYYIPYFENPVIEFAFRKGAIRLFAADRNFRKRYGFFDGARLKNCLYLFSIDDIEDIQDYLDEINKDFEEWVGGMIKKGKIRIKL